MLDTLTKITGSVAKALDIFYVAQGVKPCARILLDKKELLTWLKDNKLWFATSEFRVLPFADPSRGYSDTGRVGDRGFPVLYIAKDQDTVMQAKRSEKSYQELGRILGYPACCCEFYAKHAAEAAKQGNDFTLFTCRNSSGTEFFWQNNNCLRCFDATLLSHFPCSFSCQQSASIAMRNLSTIQKHDPELALQIEGMLRGIVIYAKGVGVYKIRPLKKEGNKTAYKPQEVLASAKNSFTALVKMNTELTIKEKSRFLVGKTEVDDQDTFVMVFK
ncbi:MAG: hypothetical protein Q7S65_04825 [Nanoarchaeota archaeon]|nr:hypothetical protein [Nanoarchaeota archaeon]